jgi:hypothetical protein
VKKLLLKLQLITTVILMGSSLTSYAVPTVTFTALAGNASTYLQQGTTNKVVFGFQMTVANGPYSPQVFNISTTSNGSSSISTNGMFTGYLASVASASPSSAVGAATQYSSLQFNSGVINITSMPSFATGTYYFYIVLNVSVSSNSNPNQIVFTLPAASAIAQNVTGVSSVTNLSTNTVYTTGKNYDWTGASTTAWSTAGNWKDNTGNASSTVPGPYDCARIGYSYSYTNTPTVTANTSVGSILFSNINQNANTLIVTTNTLTVNSDISTTSDVTSDNCSVTVSGTGTIAAVNINVGEGTAPTTNNKTFTGFITSVNNLTLSGNIYLNAYDLNGNRDFDANFLITGGTVTASNLTTVLLNVSGPAKSSISLSVTNATLNFTGASPLSNLQTTNTNNINFNGTGATIAYTGAAQTVYTNSAITGLSGGVTYNNIVFGGSGTKTPNSGTLTVDGTFSTTASTTPTVDFSTNNTILDVAGAFTNVTGATIKQGTGAFSIDGTFTNAGTFTGGSGGIDLNGTSFTNTGTFTLGGGTTNIAAATFNNTNPGTFVASSGLVNFDLAGAQSINNTNTTTPLAFYNLTLSGGNTKTLGGTGTFTVNPVGALTMAAGTKFDGGTLKMTLLSTATGTAAIEVVPSTSSITGTFNVQRFLTGGLSAANRGYRMMSSPVNQTGNPTFATPNYNTVNTSTFNLNYIKNGAFTGGTVGTLGGFSGTSVGPTLYLYKETIAANNTTTSFTSGKHVGIIRVGATDVQTLHSIDATATLPSVTIPIGNGFMFYFVGDASRTTGSATTGGAPQDATITAQGYLNQGTFNVRLWHRADALLSYAAADASARGFCMVGNPYASTINLNTVLTDNATANGISAIYVLNSRKGGTAQNFITYTNLGNSSPLLQGYAVSGGGFIVKAKAATSFLTFKESQKVPGTQLTGNGLIMSAPKADELAAGRPHAAMAMPSQSSAPQISGLYMKMEKNADVYEYTGIYFRTGYESKYDNNDALYLTPLTNTVGMASLSSDGKKAAVNVMPDYHQGSRVKLYAYAAATGIYQLKLEGVRNIDELYDIYLLDHFKKDSLDIRRYGVYNFNLVATDTATFGGNRFELVIRRKPVPQYLLTNFLGGKITEGVNVTWKTVNESNYTGFTLEKLSKSTSAYEPVYEKQSDGSAAYGYIDRAPVSGVNTYRLKQNDIDGRISYSEPITVFYDKLAGNGLINVFPNPTVEVINVSIPSTMSSPSYKLRVFNSAGNMVMQKTTSNRYWTEGVTQLKTGVYIVEVQKKDGTSLGKVKFVKN